MHQASNLLAEGGVIFADVFTAPLVEEHCGDRGEVEINPDYLFRLLEGSGLRAELMEVQSRPRLGQRLFYKFTHGFPLIHVPTNAAECLSRKQRTPC